MAQEGVINETSGAYYKIPGGNKKYDAKQFPWFALGIVKNNLLLIQQNFTSEIHE